MNKSEELINLLIQNKLITTEQLAELKKSPNFNNNSEEIIIKSGLVNIEEIINLKAKVYNLNYKNLAGVKITDQVLNVIPPEVAENYKIICFEISSGKMKVGMIDPENFKAIEAIDFLAKDQNLQPDII